MQTLALRQCASVPRPTSMMPNEEGSVMIWVKAGSREPKRGPHSPLDCLLRLRRRR